MSGVALFSQTPRCGELGHMFIVPPGLSVSETVIATFIQVVQNDVSFGENFVAVRRKAIQRLAGGAIREGQEIVVLAGVDFSRCSAHELELIVKWLRGCLENLDQLLKEGVDWSKNGDGVIIRRGELQKWLDELPQGLIPLAEWRSGPCLLRPAALHPKAPLSPVNNSAWWPCVKCGLAALLTGALSTLVLCAAFSLIQIKQSDQGKSNGSKGSPGPAPPGPSSPDVPTDQTPGITKSPDEPDKKPTNTAEPLRDAIKEKNFAAIVWILNSDYTGGSFAAEDLKELVFFAEELFNKKQYDELARLIVQIKRSRRVEGSILDQLEPSDGDRFKKVDQSFMGEDNKDQKHYDSFRSAPIDEQLQAAKDYRDQGPTQVMKSKVDKWIDWAETIIEIELREIKLRDVYSNSSVNVSFQASGRTLSCECKPKDLPAKVAITHLGATFLNFPPSISVEVTPQGGSDKFVGEVPLSRGASGETKITLRGNWNLPYNTGSMKIRTPLIEGPPELPDWKRE